MSKPVNLFNMAFGAAVVSAVGIAVCHLFLPKPIWMYDHYPLGWSIYLPLLSSPQATPQIAEQSFVYLLAYLGIMSGAAIAAGVTAVLWASGVISLIVSPFKQHIKLKLRLLPIILLLPFAIHVIGLINMYINMQR